VFYSHTKLHTMDADDTEQRLLSFTNLEEPTNTATTPATLHEPSSTTTLCDVVQQLRITRYLMFFSFMVSLLWFALFGYLLWMGADHLNQNIQNLVSVMKQLQQAVDGNIDDWTSDLDVVTWVLQQAGVCLEQSSLCKQK